jgi:DNA polymerase
MDKESSLKQLYDDYKKMFDGRDIVTGEGNLDTELVLIGEAPGKDEIRLSKPFVGMAGKNLEEFLTAIDIPRESIFITNAIKYRLFKINPKTGRAANRPANTADIRNSRQYLISELLIIQPRFLVTLGNVPLRAITDGTTESIGNVHGKLLDLIIEGKNYQVFPLYHPASIIYNRSLKETYFKDLYTLKSLLESHKSLI